MEYKAAVSPTSLCTRPNLQPSITVVRSQPKNSLLRSSEAVLYSCHRTMVNATDCTDVDSAERNVGLSQ